MRFYNIHHDLHMALKLYIYTCIYIFKVIIGSFLERNLFKAPSPANVTDKTHRCFYLALTLCFSYVMVPFILRKQTPLQNILFSGLTTMHILDKPWRELLEIPVTSRSTWPRVISHTPRPHGHS